MKKSNEFKFNLIFAFALYGFIIIITLTYTALYFLDDVLQNEFKEKVQITSNNIEYRYNEKIKNIKNIANVLSNNDIVKFNIVNDNVLEILIKTLIKTNPNIKTIKYLHTNYELTCNKNICYKQDVNVSKLKKEEKLFVKNNQIYIDIIYLLFKIILNK